MKLVKFHCSADITLSYSRLVCHSTVFEQPCSTWYMSQQLDTGMSACQVFITTQLCNLFQCFDCRLLTCTLTFLFSAGQKPYELNCFYFVQSAFVSIWFCCVQHKLQGDSDDCSPLVWQSYLWVQCRAPSEDLRHRPTSSHTSLYRICTAEQRPLLCTQGCLGS